MNEQTKRRRLLLYRHGTIGQPSQKYAFVFV
ncbi:hypothetical protein FHS15_001666 [Paenibacillus castaneae]|nr:hypothetical protein [Paenibacillus castaneae]